MDLWMHRHTIDVIDHLKIAITSSMAPCRRNTIQEFRVNHSLGACDSDGDDGNC